MVAFKKLPLVAVDPLDWATKGVSHIREGEKHGDIL